jgi:hypothetical protein
VEITSINGLDERHQDCIFNLAHEEHRMTSRHHTATFTCMYHDLRMALTANYMFVEGSREPSAI